MNENLETEESVVPVIIATVVVTIAAISAVKGLRAAVKTIRRNSEIKKNAAIVLTEETN